MRSDAPCSILSPPISVPRTMVGSRVSGWHLHGAHKAYARPYQGKQDMLKHSAQNDNAVEKKVDYTWQREGR
jgi:hypothetical protein